MATVTCSSCGGLLGPQTGRVEVRAFQVTENERKNLKAAWNRDGEGQFHHNCWRDLVRAASPRGEGLSSVEVKMIQEAVKTAELHDADALIASEAKRIGQILRTSSYPIFFTGAGISTAAGIGDFRGKDGKWTQRDKEKEHGAKGVKSSKRIPLRHLRPTYTHDAIVKLLEMGMFKYIISQNTDGLHRLSGVPADKISELHGNAFVQKCELCETRYDVTLSHRDSPPAKDFPIKKCERCRLNHRTGRMCEKKGCGGYLMNTIINFGDYLESDILDRAEENSKKADIFVCLGTTLMVSPANSLVMMGRKPNRLVICNRQKTPYDEDCLEADEHGAPTGSRIHGDCDKFMAALMKELLGEEGVKDWEEGREARLAQYDKRRQ